jgi:hypothetical protein
VYNLCTCFVHSYMAKKKTTDKRLTFKNEDCKLMEDLAAKKGMSVKKMLEFLIVGWLNMEARKNNFGGL